MVLGHIYGLLLLALSSGQNESWGASYTRDEIYKPQQMKEHHVSSEGN